MTSTSESGNGESQENATRESGEEPVQSAEDVAEPEASEGGEPESAGQPPEGAARRSGAEAGMEVGGSDAEAEATARLRETHERLLRVSADLENHKKRAAREREEIRKFGIEEVMKDLLPVLDALDRALAATSGDDPMAAGVRLVRGTLERILERHGVVGFSALGAPFDPALHEALVRVPTQDEPPGKVVVEHSRGFMLHGRLIRPAMVGVSVEPATPSE